MADLSEKIKNQISEQYNMALNSITKKEILDQLEKNHNVDVPQNLIDNELKLIPDNPNSKKDENSAQSAKKRIKLGLILNEYGETNKIKVTEDENIDKKLNSRDSLCIGY